MNILVTAGNTIVPIDQVRCITNIFTGRTGTGIALHAHQRGHSVTLLTSHPEVVAELGGTAENLTRRWKVQAYRTFDDLQHHMENAIRISGLDLVIHCAAVSDYRSAGIYAPAGSTCFRAETGRWECSDGVPALVDRAAGKVKSDEPELWLRMTRTPKLVDCIRSPWGFRGILVKFKLEVGVSEERLREIAEKSRRHSSADLMVANTLEGAQDWALLGPLSGNYERMDRQELSSRLFDVLEQMARERSHG